ncbi:MAG TPA: carboxypeptidase-like regulatory domain-containing protein, partial [Mucilaginibacter sp.]|nr:carboxypeptidase-like regulatory domain-containing protein [Mucilaginibacter sp.]
MNFTLRSHKIWCLTVCSILLLSKGYAEGHPGKDMTDISASKKSPVPTLIKGVVKDETGLPLPGVSVKIKGTTNGTQTGVDGSYSLNAQAGDVLV